MATLLMAGSAWAQTSGDPMTESTIPSGFYRFKHVSGKYLAAPAELPTSNTSNQSPYYATFLDNVDVSDAHRDIWYIENLGENASGVVYKIWCFQGGYGLATNPNPTVYGSYANDYCPRLYCIRETSEDGKYTLGGHAIDKEPVANNKNAYGLATNGGQINVDTRLRPADSNYTKLSRGGSDTDENTKWQILPVAEITKSVTFGATGMATFAYTSDTQIPEGVEAYVATESGENITLEKLDGTIPARMGVVLRRTDNSKETFDFVAVHGLGLGMSAVETDGTLTSVPDEGNKLKGTLVETALAIGDYILAVKEGTTDEVVFGKVSEASNIAPNKAYLPANAVSSARGFYSLVFGDTETGIEEVVAVSGKDGIYVQNNQVVIVKAGVKYNVNGQKIK